MNSETNPTPEDGALNQFEKQLRRQPLGPTAKQRDTIIYECGYEAGMAEASQQSRKATRRWQGISLAAAILAAVSLAFPFGSGTADRDNRLDISPRVSPPSSANPIAEGSANDAWLYHLANARRVETENARVLRTSSSLAEALSETTFDGGVEIGPESPQGSPLRATDSNLIL